MKSAKVFVAGHRGLVGSALTRALESRGYANVLKKTRQELDLTDRAGVDAFFASEKPSWVFLAAAKVGGIHGNSTYPYDFIEQNLRIQLNVIDAARRFGVQQLLFLGSSCIYPRMAPQPMSEDVLLTGELEKTNEPYAVAKIAGIKMCTSANRQYGCRFFSVMPTNLYGPNDNYHPENAHVVPMLLRRFHEAKLANLEVVKIWGSGKPLRELLHSDDLARACVDMMERFSALGEKEPLPELVNVGSGEEIYIIELAKLIAETVGYRGRIELDPSKPDGTPRKLLDSSLIRSYGWSPRIGLREGLAAVYKEAFPQS